MNTWMDKDVCVYILPSHNIKHNKMLPFATLMDLENIMLSEINQRKTNTVWYHLCVLSLSVMSDSLQPIRTVAHQTPLFMGILQERILECVAIPFSRGSSQPGDQTKVSYITGGFSTVWATREAWSFHTKSLMRTNGKYGSLWHWKELTGKQEEG